MNARSDSDQRQERRRQRRERGQRDILDAAERALVSRGRLAALTMEDIAAEAGYTPGALYGYFRSKALIERALFERIEDELALALGEPAPAALPFRAALDRFFGRLTEVALRHLPLFHAFFVLGADPRDESGRLPRLHELFVDALSELLGRGVREAVVRNSDTRDLALALLGIHREFFIRWLYSDRSTPLTARSRRAVSIFLHGAAAPLPPTAGADVTAPTAAGTDE
jgi:AcrR family transcriptional regulator